MSAAQGGRSLWRQGGNRLILAAVVLFALALVPTQAAGPRQQPPADSYPRSGAGRLRRSGRCSINTVSAATARG